MKSVSAWTAVAWFCLLVACSSATVQETAGDAEPVAKVNVETASSGGQTDARSQDIIDRMFSPLDNAVTDINRDLNKGDADASAEPKE